MRDDMLIRGRLVKSLSGRDIGKLLAVMSVDEKTVSLCDGKERPLNRPKTKNIRHIEPLSVVLTEEDLSSDRLLKKAIRRVTTENTCSI